MRKLNSLISVAILLLFVVTSCSEDNLGIKIKDEVSEHQHVNDWIYKNMVKSYLWNDDIPKKPDYSLKPNMFFESLLSSKDLSKSGKRFSSIEESSNNATRSLSGANSEDIGLDCLFITNWNYFIVRYSKKGSDAYSKGIRRGHFITAVDEEKITSSNYNNILYGSPTKKLTVGRIAYNSEIKKFELKEEEDITVKIERDFHESPIHLDTVYTIGGKKIGYMVYNFFATGKTDDSHEYDELLMNTLSNIKKATEEGAREMVLDLRYNGGGTVSTAIGLASALVKNRSTDNIIAKAEYNDVMEKIYKGDKKHDHFNYFFIDKMKAGKKELDVPNLNLSRLYVLVTRYSASASEFIINTLKPYMDVVLIGETTYGKNIGSWSISDDNDTENNWTMHPITVKFYNKEGKADFKNGFEPDFKIDEFDYIPFVEFGDLNDPLLNRAINEITKGGTRLQTKTRQLEAHPRIFEIEEYDSFIKRNRSRFEMRDDLGSERFKR